MKNRANILSSKTKNKLDILPKDKLFCVHSVQKPCQYCIYAYCHDIEKYLFTERKCPQHNRNLVYYYGDEVLYCLVGKEVFRK